LNSSRRGSTRVSGPPNRDALDHVRVESPLDQEIHLTDPPGLLLEDVDEELADDPPLHLRIRHSGERGEEALAGIHGDEGHLEALPEGPLYLLALPLTEQTVVDEDAGEPITKSPVDQGGGDGRIHPPAEPAHGAAVSDLGADRLHGLVDKRFDGPGSAAAADPVDEVGQDPIAVFGVDHLRVELKAENRLPGVTDRGEGRILAGGQHLEVPRQAHHPIAVTHPDPAFGTALQIREERMPGFDLQQGAAVLVVAGHLHQTTEAAGQELEPVADAEDRKLELEDRRGHVRRPRIEDARGPTREDQSGGLPRPDLVETQAVGMDLAVDALLADPPGDELCVLRPEVQDQNPVAMSIGGHRGVCLFDGGGPEEDRCGRGGRRFYSIR
jgi:hypothetical protein